MNLLLSERVDVFDFFLIREDAGRQAGDDFGDFVLVGTVQDIIVDQQVLAKEGQLWDVCARLDRCV